MEIGLKLLPFAGADITAHFILPSFSKNLSSEDGLTNPELKAQLLEQITLFTNSLSTDLLDKDSE